jgi:type I restriction-modification system DNA methylase subunit
VYYHFYNSWLIHIGIPCIRALSLTDSVNKIQNNTNYKLKKLYNVIQYTKQLVYLFVDLVIILRFIMSVDVVQPELFFVIAHDKFKQGEPVDNIPYIYEGTLSKELRKEKGVYYTPYHICQHMAKTAIDEWIEVNGIEKIDECKILDPACGCGLFLLAAFDYIAYLKESERKLTIEEKKQIVRNNLYGVDIDNKACEITKLLLLMKVYENARDLFFEEVANNKKVVV